MVPDGEQCERGAACGGRVPPGATRGGRVQPGAAPAPAHAWLRAGAGPAESRRLLPARAGPLAPRLVKPKAKTKCQKRKEKIIAALKPPYFILSMIIVITGVHLWGGARAAAALEWAPARARWWREPWRLLTYGCVHATDGHLALNALVALLVGWRLEREQGAWRAAALWAGGAAGGALGAGALQPRRRVVGASAAVYALLTAHLPNVAYRLGHIPLWWFRPLSVLVLAASEACWALLHAPAAPPAPAHSPVAWSAHLFGAVVGVPIAFLVFTGENKSSRWLLAARVLSALLLVALAALAGAHYGASAGQPAASAPAHVLPPPHRS